MAETAAKTAKPRKTAAQADQDRRANGAQPRRPPQPPRRTSRDEAKSRFNAALEEARAGAARSAPKPRERAGAYRDQARDAQRRLGRAKPRPRRARARRTKARPRPARRSPALGRAGRRQRRRRSTRSSARKYGDYARTASRTLQETAAKLDQKSVEELGEDAREFVRKSPAAAVGLAALAGFLLARLFRR